MCTIACSLRAQDVAHAVPRRQQRLADTGDVAVAEDAEHAAKNGVRCRRGSWAAAPDSGLNGGCANCQARVTLMPAAVCGDERLDLGQRRHEVGAAVTGDDNRAGGAAHAAPRARAASLSQP